MALACGTMAYGGDAYRPASNVTSMAQHVLVLMLRDFLATAQHEASTHGDGAAEIKCYAQDPIYTPADEKVLYEAGITVIDDPRAFLEIDDSSVVISCCPDIPVRQIVADLARPALIIWTKTLVEDGDGSPTLKYR